MSERMSRPGAARSSRRGLALGLLNVNQLLAGVGVASGMALAAILVTDLTEVPAMGGLSQSASVLGAALAAIPLARLAVRSGRHVALATGYACLRRRGAHHRRGHERVAGARVPRARRIRSRRRGRAPGALRRHRDRGPRLRGAVDVA